MSKSNYSLEQKIGQLIIMGFHGNSTDDPRVQKALQQATTGEIGGVAIFRYNIVEPQQLQKLLSAFKELKSPLPLFIGLDQEGGKVQRLKSENGFRDTKSAKQVQSTMNLSEASKHYGELAKMLKAHHFNFNWAPCVDVDDTPGCKVIGGLERSYSCDPNVVADYAATMIQSMKAEGIISCIKHFPGHGRVEGDTHHGLVDISDTWSEIELEPYRSLIDRNVADAVMSAHLAHQKIDPEYPATLSKKWLSKLRSDFGYQGLIVSDCLHMGAMIKNYSLKEIVVNGLNAGLDILLFSNNPLAAQSEGIRYASDSNDEYIAVKDWRVPDSDLPTKIRNEILAAIDSGELAIEVIEAAFERVCNLKEKLI